MDEKGEIEVRRFDDYEKKLRAAHVIVDGAERRETILHEARQKAFALGLELIDDEGLASEVMGLAEWPVVLVGEIDSAFMDLPPEILQTSMRTHQKYFALRHRENPPPPGGESLPPTRSGVEPPKRVLVGRSSKSEGGSAEAVRVGGGSAPRSERILANRFAFVANMIAEDGGKEIVAGNERVLRARLSDAKFFWDQDKKRTLESRVADLENIIYYRDLDYAEKTRRVAKKAAVIADKIGGDGDAAERAARLAKADLTTSIVGEFPELQGVMGYYYALLNRETSIVAEAIRDHYKPLGPSDAIPSSRVADAVALADKFDTLYWLFYQGERPTGSKDPYGLRRAALGTIRIILEKGYRLNLSEMFQLAWYGGPTGTRRDREAESRAELLGFFADRLKVALREKGVRHDLIDAVFALGNEDDLVRLIRRVEALQAFLKTDDGANLLVGYRRAANILKIEEKKDKREYRDLPDTAALTQAEEKALHGALLSAQESVVKLLEREDFAGAMSEMAKLRVPVDRFFDKVTVNADDKTLRENRLKLLAQIVATAHQVADFSKMEG